MMSIGGGLGQHRSDRTGGRCDRRTATRGQLRGFHMHLRNPYVMAGRFPLALHVALDVTVRALFPAALAAEADLASTLRPDRQRQAMELLRYNGTLRARRRVARSAEGMQEDGDPPDSCTWDAPDVDGCFG